MKLFLTSSPIGIYRSEEPLDYEGFNPANGLVEELKKYWMEDARCLLISAFPDDYEINDRMRGDFEGILADSGLSCSCMDLCDSRNGKEKADALHSYDFIILGGGHVPTENEFFTKINLADRFRGYQGIVMGISAGCFFNGFDDSLIAQCRCGATNAAILPLHCRLHSVFQ